LHLYLFAYQFSLQLVSLIIIVIRKDTKWFRRTINCIATH